MTARALSSLHLRRCSARLRRDTMRNRGRQRGADETKRFFSISHFHFSLNSELHWAQIQGKDDDLHATLHRRARRIAFRRRENQPDVDRLCATCATARALYFYRGDAVCFHECADWITYRHCPITALKCGANERF